MSREVLRDTIIYLPSKVIPGLVGVAAVPILTSLLPPEQYGQYLLAMTTLSLIVAFCISWLVSTIIRFNVICSIETLFQQTRRMLTFSILLACILWLVAAQLLGETFRSQLFIVAGLVWLIAYGGFEYFSGWLRGRNLAKAYSLAMSWRSVVGLLCVVTLLNLGFRDGPIVLLGFAAAMFLGLFFLPRYALKTDSNQIKLDESKSNLGILLRYGIPVAISNLFTVGLSVVDRFIINIYFGAESVAIYGANYDLGEKTIFFVNSLLLLSSSVIGFRIFERDGGAKAAEFLARIMRLYLLVASPLVVAIAVLSPNIVMVLLPEEYHAGAFVLPIVAVGGLIVGVLHRYSLVLSFNRRTDMIMWCTACALAVNIGACIFLIPRYGILGAAFGTIFAYTSWLVFVRLAASNYLAPRFPWPTLIRVCVAALISAAAMYSIIYQNFTNNLFTFAFSSLFGFISYFVALILLNEITKKEVKLISSIASARFEKIRNHF